MDEVEANDMATWTITIGAIGGLIYAVLSDPKHVWPRLIRVGVRRSLPRFGLVGHALIGMIAAGLMSIIIPANDGLLSAQTDLTWLWASSQLLFAFLTTSAIGGYADRRFLRLAIRNAASAPAGDAATVRGLDVAAPCDVCVATWKLAPPLLPMWRGRGDRSASDSSSLFGAEDELGLTSIQKHLSFSSSSKAHLRFGAHPERAQPPQ
jgi:hypothetical protein